MSGACGPRFVSMDSVVLLISPWCACVLPLGQVMRDIGDRYVRYVEMCVGPVGASFGHWHRSVSGCFGVV